MAGKETTTPVADEPLSNDTAASTKDEESNDSEDQQVDPEKALEDDDSGGFDDTDDDSDEDAEEQSEEESEDEEESEGESEESEEEETEEQSDEESTDDTKELSDEEKQKRHNNEMAQQRINEKMQREKTLEESQQKYLDGANPNKPEDLALRQLQVDAYNNKVEANDNKLTNGYQQALKDFPVLRDPNPVVQKEIDSALDAFQAQFVTVDAYGNAYIVRGDLYKYLQSKADSIKQLTGIGATQQEKNKGKEKSKTSTIPNRSPKEPKTDPDMDAFDEEAAKP